MNQHFHQHKKIIAKSKILQILSFIVFIWQQKKWITSYTKTIAKNWQCGIGKTICRDVKKFLKECTKF